MTGYSKSNMSRWDIIISKISLQLMVLLCAVMMVAQTGCGQDTSCLNQLTPCLNYLNGTKDVPSACCDPLKTAIQSAPECICYLISNQGANRAQQAGINITEAQGLPARCGIRVNPFGCITGGSPSNANNSGDTNSGGMSLLPGVCGWVLVSLVTIALSMTFHQAWGNI